MARVVVAPAANADVDELISSLGLPRTTRARVKKRLALLADFPERGEALTGRWEGFRYILGPWPWMRIIYAFDRKANQVNVVTIQDSRSVRAATSQR
jgi:mRNA-degrading endonuclease RelE of RelBE toxin-antitoxin system